MREREKKLKEADGFKARAVASLPDTDINVLANEAAVKNVLHQQIYEWQRKNDMMLREEVRNPVS